MTDGKVYSEGGDAVHGCYTNVKINITGGEISSLHGRGIITYGATTIENCTISTVDSAALRTAYAPQITIRNSTLSSECNTFQSSTIYARSSSGSGVVLKLENTNIINKKGRGIYAHGTASSCPCNVTIDGGTWNCEMQCVYSYARSVITVNGGFFESYHDGRTCHVGSSSGNLIINDGYFRNDNSTQTTVARYDTSTALTIVGGYYTNKVAKVADGYSLYSGSYKDPNGKSYQYRVGVSK